MLSIQEMRAARAAWLAANLDDESRAVCHRNGIEIPAHGAAAATTSWGDWRWHVRNRLTDRSMEEFIAMFPSYKTREVELRSYCGSYDLSILPLNLLQQDGVVKFLPRLGLQHAKDPYGVQQEHSVVTKVDGEKIYYLATHKPDYATFLPILGSGAGRVYCPIGCAGCYRGQQTRRHESLALIKSDGSKETVFIPDPVTQMRWLVEEWNTNPDFKEVYDVLVSGGEPMMLTNGVWAKMLEALAQAKHLRVLRICTGTLFLGLPFRFDDEFVQLLVNFRKKTGVQVKMSVHVSHPDNVTPEAEMFARRLIRAGVELLPQIPLEEGVNFWERDLKRTMSTLRRLGRLLAFAVGTRPYKWIVDMQGTVSLLSVIKVWRDLHDSHLGESDLTRPTSLALFFPMKEGNLNLSFHTLFAMKMRVDRERGVVTYHIPHPDGKMMEYEEPLKKGINDDPAILEGMKM